MRLLIVEPSAEGHHLALYSRLILRESCRRKWNVTILTTRSASQHPAFQIAAAETQGQLSTILIPDLAAPRSFSSLELFWSQFRLWKALADAAGRNDYFSRFDGIYCVNFDYFEKALSVFGSPFGQIPFAGMMMNPKFHRAHEGLGPPSRGDWIYFVLFQRLLRLRGLKGVLVVDEPFRDYCVKKKLKGAVKIRLVPDVGELSAAQGIEDSRSYLGIPPEKFVILVYGSLARRKGLDHLLRAVSSLDCSDCTVLAAGKPDAETKLFLHSPAVQLLVQSGQLIVKEGFLDSFGESQVFKAADAVWLGYVGGAYGSSGVLYQAGAAGLPVIAMEEGLIGWTVRAHKLGLTLDPTDPLKVMSAIKLLRDDSAIRQSWGQNGRRLSASHTGTVFGESVCNVIEKTLHGRRDFRLS